MAYIGSSIGGGVGIGGGADAEAEAKRSASCDFCDAAIGADDEFAEFWPRYFGHSYSYCLFAPRFAQS